MHNIFITNMFEDWKERSPSRKVELVNKMISSLGSELKLSPPRVTGWMTNVEQRMNMFHLAEQVLAFDVKGAFVELGCHEGQSATLLRRIMDKYGRKELHVYDSFEGLPALSDEDGSTETFYEGWGKTGQEKLLNNFALAGAEPPEIHQGWFEETLPTQLPDQIAFAHLDGDLHSSIAVSLKYVYPRMTKNAICLVDDYCDPVVHNCYNELPGVKQACDEFFEDKPESMSLLYAADHTHAYFRKTAD